jgi:hypothetical protein
MKEVNLSFLYQLGGQIHRLTEFELGKAQIASASLEQYSL